MPYITIRPHHDTFDVIVIEEWMMFLWILASMGDGCDPFMGESIEDFSIHYVGVDSA
jgi:hypothetical protein